MDNLFYFIGIDVAKLKFDVAVKKSAKKYEHRQFENNTEGFSALSAWLSQHCMDTDRQLYVVMEATNIYHEHLCEYLYAVGCSVVVINPKCSANFAKGLNLRSKTDKVDAKMLSCLAESYAGEFDLWQPKGNGDKALLRQLRHLDGLKSALAKQKVRLQMLLDEVAIDSTMRVIDFLKDEIKLVEKQVAALVKQDKQLCHNYQLLTSMPAIGKVAAWWLLATLGDGTRFKNGRAAATHAGLTPMLKQSGSSLNKRVGISRIGQSDLRRVLYMPAMVFCFGRYKDHQSNVYGKFVKRLLEHNKLAKKAVIVALMRKLVTIAQSVLKHQQPFDAERYAKCVSDA